MVWFVWFGTGPVPATVTVRGGGEGWASENSARPPAGTTNLRSKVCNAQINLISVEKSEESKERGCRKRKSESESESSKGVKRFAGKRKRKTAPCTYTVRERIYLRWVCTFEMKRARKVDTRSSGQSTCSDTSEGEPETPLTLPLEYPT